MSLGGFPKMLYIDAFAGPGSYSEGEDGSPIIAIKELLAQRLPIKAHCSFHFVELDADRARALEEAVKDVLSAAGNPQNVSAKVHNSSFKEAYPRIKSSFPGGKLPPTFAFIDPFGWTGLPFSIVRDILKTPSCEVLVNFMYEEINRFIAHPDQGRNFDSLFGSGDWRRCVSITVPTQRNECLQGVYSEQLKGAARYVRAFEMRNSKNTVDYHLFFATSNLTGLKRMKASMWKVDESGDFRFSDATDQAQLVFFSEPQFALLLHQLLARFVGHDVSIEDVEGFVLEHTAFRESHIRRQVLDKLEAQSPPRLAVLSAKAGRKRGQYPPGTIMRFT